MGIFAAGAVVTNCFTSKIQCEKCGKNYRRYKKVHKDGTELVRWRCSVKKTLGEKFCDNGDITEDELKYACTVALGEDEFDEEAFSENVLNILVTEKGTLLFTLADKSRCVVDWR